ncbi:MAG: hypothetical protein IJP86_05350 [Synergistaceae bacterium]|nr:hypothetical protein [Synergistaceae bacterium]
MIQRMRVPDRADMLREYRDKVQAMAGEFEDLLESEFAPYDRRNYEAGYTADDLRNNTRPYDDKDAPLIGRVISMLGSAYEELKQRCFELEYEEETYYEGMAMFEAWRLGLCPCVMRECRNALPRYAGDAGDVREWEGIAEYLDGAGTRREQTMRAIEAWREAKGGVKESAGVILGQTIGC